MDINNRTLTLQEFVQSFEKLKHPLSLPESEESWDQIYSGFQQLRKLCQSGAFEHTAEVIASFRSIHRDLISAMNSERTRLSGVVLDVLSTLAAGLSTDFDPLLPLFFPSLLSLCGRTNKVIVSRAKGCIFAIIEATQLPSIINYLSQFSKDKSPTVRLVTVEGTLSCLKCFNPPDLEKESLSLCIETLIRNSVRDANPDIRKVGKEVFRNYKTLLPDRVENFIAPLTPTIRKYLQLTAGNVTSHDRLASVAAQPRPISRVSTQDSKTQSTLNSGLGRPSKNPSISKPKPVPPTRSLEPSRAIQVSAKYTTDTPFASLAQQKTSITSSRPFAQDKNATGPQRVIKSDRISAGASSILLMAKNDIKPPTTRLAGASRSRAVSSSSLTRSSGFRPAAHSDNQTPITRKDPDSIKPPGHTGASVTATRNLSRPTLSQLARVRPPVTKSVPKTTRGLKIHKTKPTAKPESNRPTTIQGRSLNKGRSVNVPAGPLKGRRPITPALIPLPPSPNPSTPTANLNPSSSTTLGALKPESQPVLIVAPTDGQALTQALLGAECSGKEPPFPALQPPTSVPASTPVADGHTSDPNPAFKTPISALLSSIQHGFNLTPCSPLSPPQDYLVPSDSPLELGPFRLGILKQNVPTGAQL